MPGPVPKRPDQRRRTNSPSHPQTDSAAAIACTPLAADESWHPIAKEFYDSLAKSGQSVFYQASDWAVARYVAEAMSRSLAASRFSAHAMQAVLGASASLLATEGDRRRLRLHLEAARPAEVDASVSVIRDWQRKLSTEAET